MNRFAGCALVGLALILARPGTALPQTLAPASLAEQSSAIGLGGTTSEALAHAAIELIDTVDRAGPRLNSILTVNPRVLEEARASDARRRAGRQRSPLDGVTIVLKDNIEVAGEMPTTAGSLALIDNVTRRDSTLSARLRGAGIVVLGKSNLSEWANYRSARSVSGWSAVGGLVRNPFILDRSPCGSSSGSAVAVAVGIAAAGIGTETNGSIVCPAAANGLVGLKPTVGLVPRTHIVPLSPVQDTAGPITHTVSDAASLLSVIAGSDPLDPSTREADARKTDYAAQLRSDALRGARIGVIRGATTSSPEGDRVFEIALQVLRAAGATLVETPPQDAKQHADATRAANEALLSEFHDAMDRYLVSAAPAVRTRTLRDLIAFNAATPAEIALFGQDTFEAAIASPPLSDPVYQERRATASRKAGPEGLDRMMHDAGVEILVAQTGAPASVLDPVNGTRFLGSPSALPAIAGYPHLTVPMGEVLGLPVGLSFIGPKWGDARLLSLGYAFEQAMGVRLTPKLLSNLSAQPGVAEAFDPARSGGKSSETAP